MTNWVEIAALVLGPVLAVALTLVIEGRRNVRDQRLQVLRALIQTRALPGDPAWTLAVSRIPVEFDTKMDVIADYKEFIKLALTVATLEN